MSKAKYREKALAKSFLSERGASSLAFIRAFDDPERPGVLSMLPRPIVRDVLSLYAAAVLALELQDVRCSRCGCEEDAIFTMRLVGLFVQADGALYGAMFDAAALRPTLRTRHPEYAAAPEQEHCLAIWQLDPDLADPDDSTMLMESDAPPHEVAACFIEATKRSLDFVSVETKPNREPRHCPRCCLLVGVRARARAALTDREHFAYSESIEESTRGAANVKRRRRPGGPKAQPYVGFFGEIADVVERDASGRVRIDAFRQALAQVFGLGDARDGERKIVWPPVDGNDVSVGYDSEEDKLWADWDGGVKSGTVWKAAKVLERFQKWEKKRGA